MGRSEQRAHALDQPSSAPNVRCAPIFSPGKGDGILLGVKVVCPRALVTRWIKRVICGMMAQPLEPVLQHHAHGHKCVGGVGQASVGVLVIQVPACKKLNMGGRE